MDLATGLFVLTKTDLALTDVLPVAVRRTYRQNDTGVRAFGIGTNHDYSLALYSENGFLTISLILPDGGRIRYQRTSSGTGYADAVLEHTARFYEPGVPSFVIPVTRGDVVLFYVEAPR